MPPPPPSLYLQFCNSSSGIPGNGREESFLLAVDELSCGNDSACDFLVAKKRNKKNKKRETWPGFLFFHPCLFFVCYHPLQNAKPQIYNLLSRPTNAYNLRIPETILFIIFLRCVCYQGSFVSQLLLSTDFGCCGPMRWCLWEKTRNPSSPVIMLIR